jgi:hypothetical protein
MRTPAMPTRTAIVMMLFELWGLTGMELSGRDSEEGGDINISGLRGEECQERARDANPRKSVNVIVRGRTIGKTRKRS